MPKGFFLGVVGRDVVRLAAAAAATLGVLLPTALFSGTIQYQYDSLGRLVAVISNNGARVDYAYDAAGNRTVQTEDASGAAYPVEFIVEGGFARQV